MRNTPSLCGTELAGVTSSLTVGSAPLGGGTLQQGVQVVTTCRCLSLDMSACSALGRTQREVTTNERVQTSMLSRQSCVNRTCISTCIHQVPGGWRCSPEGVSSWVLAGLKGCSRCRVQ